MFEWLESIDRSIVLAVNGLNAPWLDEVMWVISGKVLWIPLYIFIFYLGIKSFGFVKSLKFLALTVICIAVADLISVHLFKNVFERYRPSHHLLLTNKLHFYELKPGEFYRCGQFGFVSSHAANFFALATFVGLCFCSKYRYFFPFLLGIAALISFSRLYLGVHYLSDLIAGASIGALVSYAVWRAFWKK